MDFFDRIIEQRSWPLSMIPVFQWGICQALKFEWVRYLIIYVNTYCMSPLGVRMGYPGRWIGKWLTEYDEKGKMDEFIINLLNKKSETIRATKNHTGDEDLRQTEESYNEFTLESVQVYISKIDQELHDIKVWPLEDLFMDYKVSTRIISSAQY